MDFEKLKIAEGIDWDVFLHADQSLPGRLYFWYKKEAGDLLDLPKEAILELFELGKEARRALVEVFGPDSFNYLCLNNKTRHLHVHLLPRYAKKISFGGLIFEDINFGKSYKTDPGFVVDEKIILKIKDEIKRKFKTAIR